ncbi:MAG TPA: transglycosylase domain-containing protein [Candidatus Acidoferrales bacterium]|nr:transglycosylase domain-containing protein [Candidatus Acidoferrales bacterium]
MVLRSGLRYRGSRRWALAILGRVWFQRIRAGALAAAQGIRGSRAGKLQWRRGVVRALAGTAIVTSILAAGGIRYICFDRTNLPDLRAFSRFELPTTGHVYDINGRPLLEIASEYRQITRYEDIPPIVRGAIVAAEDKNFFSHSGVDYSAFARVVCKLRLRDLLGRLTHLGRRDAVNSAAIFPQGGSTITQQLVRGYFLKTMTAQENSDQLRHSQSLARALSGVVGSRTVNMLVRKLEEIRLSLWVEAEMQARFGSKRRAKEEILARYASLIYMGNGQYGLARGAEYYFGRPLATFTADDADKAALLAGTAKSARYYAPNASQAQRVVERRNQILTLMAARGFISPDQARLASRRPIETVAQHQNQTIGTSAVVDSILDELKGGELRGTGLKNSQADLSEKDLLQGHIQVYSTVDARVQEIANQALERGLLLYEKRHASARGLVQGSVVVLRNRDASIVAETGGRQSYKDRFSAYSDFNRATKSLRQPGSTMKPIVYLAAFRKGTFNLDTVVPDEPISISNGAGQNAKRIANYDGEFKGMIPLRMALAESRNAVAIWIAGQIGIASILETARKLGIQTPLQPNAATALGASEVNLLELANAYRTIASGILTQPRVIRKIVLESGEVIADSGHGSSPVNVPSEALALIQEGLRGVVRMPGGTAHALDSFPLAVMGKTGTTSEFRDALFVGSTYGPEGITVAVRIGFDDNRSLGAKETGGRVALPVFREIVLGAYREKLVGPAPKFPPEMEERIDVYLQGDAVETSVVTNAAGSPRPPGF